MRIVGVIPARYGSTRFPGKPLVLINGKPLIVWAIEGARRCRSFAQVIVATDDERIAVTARASGADVVMTASDLPTGTDRVWQAVRNIDADVIVNVQGDEPLVDGELLEKLVEPFHATPGLNMATLGRPMTQEALAANTVAKIVLNQDDEALYFSRFPIPYSRIAAQQGASSLPGCLQHIGIYAYRKDFLRRFCDQPPVLMEQLEGLEQLRALYLGARIKVVRVEHESWGVDTPDDVQKIEKIMLGEG